MSAPRPLVLCVDDEPNVLEGLALHVRRRFELLTATSGADALALAAQHPALAVVMSDMRMPGMSGAELLARLRVERPDATRLLLTGHSDLDSAIQAINEGHVFRFLTKPCPPATVLGALADGAEQHRLVTAERELLERTLRGAVRALADVLALANPTAFGSASLVRRQALELAEAVAYPLRWQLEVASLLLQLGAVALDPELLERIESGAQLQAEEQQAAARIPEVATRLLADIPRLDEARALIQLAGAPSAPPGRDPVLRTGGAILRLATDAVALERRGMDAEEILRSLRGREAHPKELVEALASLRHVTGRDAVRELSLRAVSVGMVFADDVRLASGALLVARGYEVTPGFLERSRGFAPGTVREPLRVVAASIRA
ncbi:MAG: response regulator [Polyangiaceae bacterium]|nr:response regulator [Polyangiaceae bacterium]